MARETWLLVANPSAQSGLAEGRVGSAVAAMATHGVPVEVLHTLPDGGTVDAVAAALRGGTFGGVVAMGGDGTFHEVANGLLRSGKELPLGLIPAGTGNNQARSLGLALGDLDAAAACIAAGRTTPMDGARLSAWDTKGVRQADVWAFDSIGFGFSARTLQFRFEDKAAVERTTFLRDLYQGELVYAGAAVRALVTSYFEDHRFDARVTTAHGTVLHEDLHDLIINNTRIYARAWVIDPTSRHDDGEMEMLPIRGMDEWATHALVSLEGNPLRDWMEADTGAPVVRTAHFEIELVGRPDEPDIPAQVDGEPWPTVSRVRIDVHRAALSVLVDAERPP
jgi:diacylglycerol kinase family enzyme